MIPESASSDFPHSRHSALESSRIPIIRILNEIAKQPNTNLEILERLSQLSDLFDSQPEIAGPFLSVLLRTQGTRMEAFKDALLCLSAQTDTDFELLVLLHNAEERASEEILAVVHSQPKFFADRIRVVNIAGGTRGTPLNRGLAEAKGEYISVYDDDDLLFANWIEEFHRGSWQAEGRALRANTAVQMAAATLWPHGEEGFATSSWPAADYPTKYSAIEHFRVNQSPFMSFAFPIAGFRLLGLSFDERLAVCEDWDIILRASMLCDVQEVDSLTSIYRRWKLGNSSYTDHSSAIWSLSEALVIEKVNIKPIILPPGSVDEIRDLLQSREEYRRVLNSRAWRLARPIRGGVRVAVSIRERLRSTLSRRRSVQ